MSNIAQSRLHDLKVFCKSLQDATVGLPTETRDVFLSGFRDGNFVLTKDLPFSTFFTFSLIKKREIKLDARISYIFFSFLFFFSSNYSGEIMVSIEALYDPNSKIRDFHTIYEALYIEQRLLNMQIEVIDDNSTYLKLKHVIFSFYVKS